MTNFAPFERILLSVFTFALLLNGLNPLAYSCRRESEGKCPSLASADSTECSSILKNSLMTLEAADNTNRMLGYIESSVNEVKLTVIGIDRKMNKFPLSNAAGK